MPLARMRRTDCGVVGWCIIILLRVFGLVLADIIRGYFSIGIDQFQVLESVRKGYL